MEQAEAVNPAPAHAAALPQLFPVRAIRCDPSNLGTADCTHICRCDDGSDYAIKSVRPTPAVRHVEWFCYRLADRVGLACPPSRIVDMAGDLVFGSRWETGEVKNWWVEVKNGTLNLDDLKSTISRMYALDLFVHNDDRHLNNFFVRRQQLGAAMICMDFSRSWLCRGFPPSGTLPMPPTCNTVAAHRILMQQIPQFFELDECIHVLESLKNVSSTDIVSFMGSHPEEWLENEKKKEIIDWWDSDAKSARIDSIAAGLGDGTYR